MSFVFLGGTLEDPIAVYHTKYIKNIQRKKNLDLHIRKQNNPINKRTVGTYTQLPWYYFPISSSCLFGLPYLNPDGLSNPYRSSPCFLF